MNRTGIRANLKAHLKYLAVQLKGRSIYQPKNLKAAETYILNEFKDMGYTPQRQSYTYMHQQVANIVAGDPNKNGHYILGAHFDTVTRTPGADDNASGIAVLLEVSRLARNLKLPNPWTFIGFTCEEPPAFATPDMGSRVYAAQENQDKILGMLCLDMVGYYRQTPNSQNWPPNWAGLNLPTTGNFLSLISDWNSKGLLKNLEAGLKSGSPLPIVSLTVKDDLYIPEIRFSDHANFWDIGCPAVMLTDTAFLRNPYYHHPGDTIDTLDFEAMTNLVLGLVNFIQQKEAPNGR